MAVHDFQDQEEIENFKYFWRHYGRWIFYVLLCVAAGYLIWTIYQNRLQSKNDEASSILSAFVHDISAHNIQGAKEQLIKLQKDFDYSLPAAQATFIMAGSEFGSEHYDAAERHLKWIKEHNQSPLVQVLAAQRLATVYLQKKQYDEALLVLDISVPTSFKPVLLATRGDVLQAQGKIQESIQAYKEAIGLLPTDDPERRLLQMKVDQLS